MNKLWSEIKVGNLKLLYCLVMVLMICSRVEEDGILGELIFLYYV